MAESKARSEPRRAGEGKGAWPPIIEKGNGRVIVQNPSLFRAGKRERGEKVTRENEGVFGGREVSSEALLFPKKVRWPDPEGRTEHT